MPAVQTRSEHTMTRLDIHTGQPFEEFVRAFEQAAPPFDAAAVQRISESGGGWADVVSAVAANAPNGLMIFAKIDATPLMAVAGHRMRCVEYLLGNHVTAESMFRHDPVALLYAPLRILVRSDDYGWAVFILDQPSTVFAGLGVPDVTKVGLDLDRKVAGLLRAIGVRVPETLAE